MTRRPSELGKTSVGELAAQAAAALREVAGSALAACARRDSLTGLFDDHTLHAALTEAVDATRRRGGHIGLLFIDLDRFKEVNDRHGHVTGSRVLSQVARLVDDAARQSGGFAGRYGGDEFVVVLPDADMEECLRAAEALRATLATTLLAGGEPPRRRPLVRLTCSIGAASLRTGPDGEVGEAPSPEAAAMRLLQSADDAMYRAKRTSRNHVAAGGDQAAEASGAA